MECIFIHSFQTYHKDRLFEIQYCVKLDQNHLWWSFVFLLDLYVLLNSVLLAFLCYVPLTPIYSTSQLLTYLQLILKNSFQCFYHMSYRYGFCANYLNGIPSDLIISNCSTIYGFLIFVNYHRVSSGIQLNSDYDKSFFYHILLFCFRYYYLFQNL